MDATKTINAPGSSAVRVAQACDRCRAKKTKCDGNLPTCSTCAAVGFKCIVSDKLLRRAFPKGYTETLEERIRQLEAENSKLAGMVDLRDEQLGMLRDGEARAAPREAPADGEAPAAAGSPSPAADSSAPSLTSSNLHRHTHDTLHLHLHDHHDGVPCSCLDLPAARPVSVAGSLFDDVLHEQHAVSIPGSIMSDDSDDEWRRDVTPAPGAFAAATAIAHMRARQPPRGAARASSPAADHHLLTQLVAISIPRLTEETLCIPALLAKVGQAYGYASKAAILTANAFAALKERPPVPPPPALPADARFVRLLALPLRVDMDHLVAVYFQGPGAALPILQRDAFLKAYVEFAEGAQNCKLAATLVLVASLAQRLAHHDGVVRALIQPTCAVTLACSIQLLQILALALQYSLTTGDTATCYELRGRVISMAHQLRLHRCPAAVLDAADTAAHSLRQGERRILFWCIYSLDVYSSLTLGVPRLLKDFEIECATPFAGDDDAADVNVLVVNNTRLLIVGKVLQFSFSITLYLKVLGGILDLIFLRYDSGDRPSTREHTLECWRRQLPAALRFDVDAGGAVDPTWLQHQLTLVLLYYHAKILIYLPVIAQHSHHHDVGLSQKQRLARPPGDFSSNVVLSASLVQQLALQILAILRTHHAPVPMCAARQQAHLALLVARGTLDYVKNGPLYQRLKLLLLDTVSALHALEGPAALTANAVQIVELAVLSILGLTRKRAKLRLSNLAGAAGSEAADAPDAGDPDDAAADAAVGARLGTTSPPLDLDLDGIFEFDPFKLHFSGLLNEFAADGSLGLVPFLEPEMPWATE